MNQRFYVMVECKKKLEPKEILFALREARPNWGDMSASIAVQQSFAPDSLKAGDSSLPEIVKSENALPAEGG